MAAHEARASPLVILLVLSLSLSRSLSPLLPRRLVTAKVPDSHVHAWMHPTIAFHEKEMPRDQTCSRDRSFHLDRVSIYAVCLVFIVPVVERRHWASFFRRPTSLQHQIGAAGNPHSPQGCPSPLRGRPVLPHTRHQRAGRSQPRAPWPRTRSDLPQSASYPSTSTVHSHSPLSTIHYPLSTPTHSTR